MPARPKGSEGDPRGRFEELKRLWQAETDHLSQVSQMAMSWPYQRIIGMGEAALPLILKDLSESEEPDHWFWALSAISGENPIPDIAQGNVKAMAMAWLDWGARNGYLTA